MFSELYKQIINEIDLRADELWELSTNLFNNPETAFKEYKSCKLLTETLRSSGYSIETGIGGLETAFRASLGEEARTKVAILAEYDALVGLGHACGHNLIAAAAVGAGIGLASIVPSLTGQVQVIGTPAEEGGGGKIILAEAGVFKDIDAAMMFHPASKNMVLRQSLASCRLKLEFYGKASHAAAAPEEGINALDALILTYNNVNVLRSTFIPQDRVAGIIVHGGEAANIIPAYTSAEFSIRALKATRRDELANRVIGCAQAGAEAVGCQLKYELTPGYMDIIPNRILGELFRANLETLGRVVVDPDQNERMGSTDMGDVSHLVPAIHPYLAIAPENIAGHTEEFKEYSNSEAGRAAMLDAAKAMAMTTVDLLSKPDLLTKAKEELAFELKSS
ncbi:MAG: M20 family metallopeptidase [Anaerolineales bacterium]